MKLSVKVTKEGTNGLSPSGNDISGSQVRVLQNGTLTSVASGALSPSLEYATNVPAGQYQVCVDPPLGWGSTARGTQGAGRLDLLRGRSQEGTPDRDVPPDAADPRGGLVSAHGQRRPEPGGSPARGPAQFGPAQLGWALVIVVAALIGGLAADRLGHASLLIAVIVSLVAGALGVVVLLRSPARPPELSSGYPEDAETRGFPGAAAPPRPHPPARAAGPAGGRPARRRRPPHPPRATRRPAPPRSAGATRRAGPRRLARRVRDRGRAAAAAGPGRGRRTRPGGTRPRAPRRRARAPNGSPAPDLSTYLASTFIAQCPRCGAFRLDHRRARNGWDFRCESCDHVWTWQPGTPWPPVRVMPGGARPPGP